MWNQPKLTIKLIKTTIRLVGYQNKNKKRSSTKHHATIMGYGYLSLQLNWKIVL